MPGPRPPARLPNARRRRPDTRRSQFEHTPENQMAQIVAVRLVNPDSLEVQFDRPVTRVGTGAENLFDTTVSTTATEWAQTSPLTWEAQMGDDCNEGDAWMYDTSINSDFSPRIAGGQSGLILPN